MNYPILITSDANIYYFTKFKSSNACVLLKSKDDITIITDFRYKTAANATGFKTLILQSGETLVGKVVNELKNESTLYFESEYLSAKSYIEYSKSFKMIPLDQEFLDIRQIKTDEEVALIKKAADIASYAYLEVIPFLQEGVCEKEVCAKLEWIMKEQGASGVSFETIVAFGENAALPHHESGDRQLKPGDVVLVDMGARYKNYCSDMTRTSFYKEVSKEGKIVYNIVKEAQQKGLDMLKPNVVCGDIDNEAREHISSLGYGEYFGHSLGHGVGIDIHEEPYLKKTCKKVLKSGMIVTIEPGIYLPGKLGVRIEDLCVITQDGYINLTNIDKKLQIYGGKS